MVKEILRIGPSYFLRAGRIRPDTCFLWETWYNVPKDSTLPLPLSWWDKRALGLICCSAQSPAGRHAHIKPREAFYARYT